MPKEFQTWVSEMSNSIEDTSKFIKPSFDLTTMTNLQRRLIIADLLVNNPQNEDEIHDWVTAFCVGLSFDRSGNRELIERPISHILSQAVADAYIDTDGDRETKAWYNKLREVIISGRTL